MLEELKNLIHKFSENETYYKKSNYNEHSCRNEFIDPLLEILGWDVSNKQNLLPQYREVIVENYEKDTGRPDYTLNYNGMDKFCLEAKKPSINIIEHKDSAIQARRYGWNKQHKISILTNFEYLVIYDATIKPEDSQESKYARFKYYYYKDYIHKVDEIKTIISKESVYLGESDNYLLSVNIGKDRDKQEIDELFFKQINKWRIKLAEDLYVRNDRYKNSKILNDVVQEFLNQIIFLRICEDRNMPIYHTLKETMSDREEFLKELEKLFKDADSRYDSGLFDGNHIIFDSNSDVVVDIIEDLYYPKSPYMFEVMKPNILGKIYELVITEQIQIEDENINLIKKNDFINKSIVTTPVEIVKYMVRKSLGKICRGKTPEEILQLRIADIACGSGVFLEEVFEFLQEVCIEWYLENDEDYLLNLGNGRYKLPYEDKKNILLSCIYGVDIDVHAVESCKFSLLVKLIQDENKPSVTGINPILPELNDNIHQGNSLISMDDLGDYELDNIIVPYDWNSINNGETFNLIIGNPPYVNTSDMKKLLPEQEINIYNKQFYSAYRQYDKYFLFIERGIELLKEGGYLSFIVPNKFIKIKSGKNLRKIISENKYLVQLDDFGSSQLFERKTTYSSIIELCKRENDSFKYSSIKKPNDLWENNEINFITVKTDEIDDKAWKLSDDIESLKILRGIESSSEPLGKIADVFNGIQTSAERPIPIYWFSDDEVIDETEELITYKRDSKLIKIEKSLLKKYFKPVKKQEKGLNSYVKLKTDKRIIFPYDDNGRLIDIETMKKRYANTWEYLKSNYDRLVPKQVDDIIGKRDVPNSNEETWYQYGRTQSLTSFANLDKLIVGILSKEPMYVYDNENMLIASGGTAGYCAISKKEENPYSLDYLQAILTSPIIERFVNIIGSDFESGFVSRGTSVLSELPIIKIDFEDENDLKFYEQINKRMRNIRGIVNKLDNDKLDKNTKSALKRRKDFLIRLKDDKIEHLYKTILD